KLLSPVLDVPVEGAGTFDASAHRAHRGAPLSIAFKGSVQNAVVEGRALAPLGAHGLNLDGHVVRKGDGALELDQATIAGDRISIKGKGRLEPALDAALDIDGDIAALAAVMGATGEGSLRGRVEGKGLLNRPVLAVRFTGENASISGRRIGTLT